MRKDRLKLTTHLGALATFVILSLTVPSEAVVTFEKTYSGSVYESAGFSVQQTSDGGYVVVGMTHPPASSWQDIYLVRTDPLGDSLWARRYGGEGYDWGCAIEEDSSGGYVFTGGVSLGEPGSCSALLVKTDSLGNSLWEKTYGGEYAGGTSLVCLADDGYAVAGWSSSPVGGDYDAYFVKTDDVGNELWEFTYGGSGHDYGHSIEQSSDGGFLIVGSTTSYGNGDWDVYVARTDPVGNLLWDRSYGGPAHDYGYSVESTPDGGYVIAGWTSSFGAGGEDIYLIKVDSLGNEQWTRTYGGILNDQARCVHRTPDHGYILTGASQEPDSDHADVFLLKADSSGSEMWLRMYGGPYGDGGHDVKPTSDGGYVVAGLKGVRRERSYCDVYLIKTDGVGRVGECQPVEPWQPKTQGYWRRRCKDDSVEDICTYVDSVHVLADLFDAFDCDSICSLMEVSPPERDMCRKAKRQFMALLLNVASGKLAVCNCLENGSEVGDVVVRVDSLLSGDPDSHICEHAKTLADGLNNGIGIVPCDTFWALVPPKAVQSPFVSVVPNPFFKSTVIEYEVRVPGRICLQIFDKAGRLVRTVVDAEQAVGAYRVEWDGLDSSARRMPAGMYFTRLELGKSVSSSKIVLLR